MAHLYNNGKSRVLHFVYSRSTSALQPANPLSTCSSNKVCFLPYLPWKCLHKFTYGRLWTALAKFVKFSCSFCRRAKTCYRLRLNKFMYDSPVVLLPSSCPLEFRAMISTVSNSLSSSQLVSLSIWTDGVKIVLFSFGVPSLVSSPSLPLAIPSELELTLLSFTVSESCVKDFSIISELRLLWTRGNVVRKLISDESKAAESSKS